LSVWAEDPEASVNTAVRDKYLAVYGILGVFQSVSVLAAVIVVTIGTLKSSIMVTRNLKKEVIGKIYHCFSTATQRTPRAYLDVNDGLL
jgi:hypothetical protein